MNYDDQYGKLSTHKESRMKEEKKGILKTYKRKRKKYSKVNETRMAKPIWAHVFFELETRSRSYSIVCI